MESVDDVAAAIIEEMGVIDTFSLQKLLYYTQSWTIAVSNSPLFSDEIQAWKNGPVVKSVFQKHEGTRTVSGWKYGNGSCLSDSSRKIVSLVCSEYGKFSGQELVDKTHREAPWVIARGDLEEDASSEEVITVDSMKAYFRAEETLKGLDAVEIALSGMLHDGGLIRCIGASQADTPIYSLGSKGITSEQLQKVRSRRRTRTKV